MKQKLMQKNPKRSYNISFRITLFMGNARSGKTLSMVALTYKIWLDIKSLEEDLLSKPKLSSYEKNILSALQDFEIWSNLDLNKRIYGKYYKKKTLDDILELYKNKVEIKNKLLVFDDLFKDLDNRKFATNKNQILSYFITEIGKKQNILLYVSHFSTKIEKRVREMTQDFIECKKGKYFSIRLPSGKLFQYAWIEDKDYFKLEMNQSNLKRMIIQHTYYKDYIDYKKEFTIPTRKFLKVEYLKASGYFNHYKTGEII